MLGGCGAEGDERDRFEDDDDRNGLSFFVHRMRHGASTGLLLLSPLLRDIVVNIRLYGMRWLRARQRR